MAGSGEREVRRRAERKVIEEYNREHWPADMLPDEWRRVDYGAAVGRAMVDLARGATRAKIFVRVAGQSGAGKSTQLLPAVARYFEVMGMVPVVVGARKFVGYHPYLKEIFEKFGEENVRECTHEFTVMMMFEVLGELIRGGYAIVLDVTLLDPRVERVLVGWLVEAGYESEMHLMAVAKEISDEFIRKRERGGAEGRRKVRRGTADEFLRATPVALEYYAGAWPEMGMTMWSAFDLLPVYVGRVGDGRVGEVFEECWGVREMPVGAVGEGELRAAKARFMEKRARERLRGNP